jgi:hypothetical protein
LLLGTSASAAAKSPSARRLRDRNSPASMPVRAGRLKQDRPDVIHDRERGAREQQETAGALSLMRVSNAADFSVPAARGRPVV